jgi:ribonuclease Z
MRPNLHPRLVNGRFGDPALFVEVLHRREALLFDAGDLSSLSTRDLLRVEQLFISHMHMDHFIGFDTLLRVNLGREKTIRVVGPIGIVECIAHKLKGYAWDLVDRYQADLVIEVLAAGAEELEDGARFAFKRRFEREPLATPWCLLPSAALQVEIALLEHHGPCLGFALSEPEHYNVWKSRLTERGLHAGPWLEELKGAIRAGATDTALIPLGGGETRQLGELRDLVTISRGQKLAYVTDVADTASNRASIVNLARDADLLFLEARFADADRQAAHERAHLTTTAAGEIAREAKVRRFEPFHFSARYRTDETRMLDEAAAAFHETLQHSGSG